MFYSQGSVQHRIIAIMEIARAQEFCPCHRIALGSHLDATPCFNEQPTLGPARTVPHTKQRHPDGSFIFKAKGQCPPSSVTLNAVAANSGHTKGEHAMFGAAMLQSQVANPPDHAGELLGTPALFNNTRTECMIEPKVVENWRFHMTCKAIVSMRTFNRCPSSIIRGPRANRGRVSGIVRQRHALQPSAGLRQCKRARHTKAQTDSP